MAEKKKTGRPTVFTPELLAEIIKEISEGETERGCFRKPGRPDWSSWCKFKQTASEEFFHQLAIAEKAWCAVHEDLCRQIAMDDSKDVHNYEERIDSEKNGLTVKTGATTDNTSVNRARLQIDTIRNLMKWKMPERYGDKVQQELTGKDGAALIPAVLNISIVTKDGSGNKTGGS